MDFKPLASSAHWKDKSLSLNPDSHNCVQDAIKMSFRCKFIFVYLVNDDLLCAEDLNTKYTQPNQKKYNSPNQTKILFLFFEIEISKIYYKMAVRNQNKKKLFVYLQKLLVS